MQILFGSVKILIGLKYYNLVHLSEDNWVFRITNNFVCFPPHLHNTAVTDAYNVSIYVSIFSQVRLTETMR